MTINEAMSVVNHNTYFCPFLGTHRKGNEKPYLDMVHSHGPAAKRSDVTTTLGNTNKASVKELVWVKTKYVTYTHFKCVHNFHDICHGVRSLQSTASKQTYKPKYLNCEHNCVYLCLVMERVGACELNDSTSECLVVFSVSITLLFSKDSLLLKSFWAFKSLAFQCCCIHKWSLEELQKSSWPASSSWMKDYFITDLH